MSGTSRAAPTASRSVTDEKVPESLEAVRVRLGRYRRDVNSTPLDSDEFRRWRVEADAALKGARLHADAGLHNWACFGSEQAAQLAVKGLLHGLGRGPWGHDLVYLAEQLAQVVDVSEGVLDACRRLSRHYIPARYPDAHPSGPPGAHYGAGDSAQALADAALMFAFVDARWDELQA